ncbi:MAG: metallophosphoesterase family protein, partial [Nocardioidaceae bacterium]
IYRSAAFVDGCPAHVHVLAEPGATPAVAGVEIVAAPWFSKRPLADLVAQACADLTPGDGVLRVVAGHGATDTLNPDRDDVATIGVAGLQRVLDDGRADFVVLGDRHSTTRVADRIWYPGAPEVTDRDETDPGNVLVVDLADDGSGTLSVEPVHTGEWTFVDHAHELTGPEDVRELAKWLEECPAKERTAVWLRLSGTLSIQDKATLDDVLDHHELLFAALSLWRRHYDLSVLPDDTDFGDLGLTGFAEDAVTELVTAASAGGDGANTAQDALGLLFRLSGGSR